MGVDVYGKAPANETGKYFRNNWWWWRPLWNYCLQVAPVASKVVYGHFNDGDGLDAEDSLALAQRLRVELGLGHTAQFAAEYEKARAAIPDEVCKYCNGTGDRKGLEPPEWKVQGCLACHGTGKVRPCSAEYPFSVDNVEKFTAFLESCGGFEIY